MKKKSVVSFLVVVALLIIASFVFILASRPAAYQNIVLGHGGDQVAVVYNGQTESLDDALFAIQNNISQLPGATIVPPAAQSSFLVRVDAAKDPSYNGAELPNIGPCPTGYGWVGHIHSSVPSGNGMIMDSFEPNFFRESYEGWFALCLQSTDRNQQDIKTVISSNECDSSRIDSTSCPSGYSLIGTVTRHINSVSTDCADNAPQLDSISGIMVNGGTLLICEKGMANYSIVHNANLGVCNSGMTALGGIISTDHNINSGFDNFCFGGLTPSSNSGGNLGSTCASNPNSCGMRLVGTIQSNGICSASPPPENLCNH